METEVLLSRLNRRRFLMGTLGVSGMALLAACGSDDDDPTPTAAATATSGASDAPAATPTEQSSNDEAATETPSGETDPTPTSEAAEPTEEATEEPSTVVPSGTLTIAQGSDARTLDPFGSTFTFDQNIYGQVYEKLLSFSPDMTEINPHLASAIEMVDSTTWELTVQEGVTFHNGEVLDAEAVRFSLEKLLASPNHAFFTSPLQGATVEVVDDMTVSIKTAAPTPLVPLILAQYGWVVPPQHTQDAGEDIAAQPVGTGPFKFVEWQRDQAITLEVFEDYWAGTPALERVVFRPIPESAARVAALQAGEVDLINTVPLDAVSRIESDSKLSLISVPGMRVYLLTMDYREADSPFTDKRVRQAMNYAIDKEGIIASLFQGHGDVLKGQILTEAYFGFNSALEPYPYDPAKAKELLAEAGYPDGFETTLNYTSGRYTLDKEIGETVIGQLAAVGIRVQSSILEAGVFSQRTLSSELGPLFYSGTLVPPDAWFMYITRTVGQPLRYFPPVPEIDDLIEEAGSELDQSRRAEIYAQISELTYDDPPWIYLWSISEHYGVNQRVSGWVPRQDETILLDGVSVE